MSVRRKWVFDRSKNVGNFGRALEKVKELSTKFECRKSEEGKVKDLTCKWVANNSKLMEYFIIAP